MLSGNAGPFRGCRRSGCWPPRGRRSSPSHLCRRGGRRRSCRRAGSRVSHRYPCVDNKRETGICAEDAAVLDVRPFADLDPFRIAADHCAVPDAHSRPDSHSADDEPWRQMAGLDRVDEEGFGTPDERGFVAHPGYRGECQQWQRGVDSSSTAVRIRAIVATVSSGYAPTEVSPESITASAPSRTALPLRCPGRAGPGISFDSTQFIEQFGDRRLPNPRQPPTGNQRTDGWSWWGGLDDAGRGCGVDGGWNGWMDGRPPGCSPMASNSAGLGSSMN